LKCMVEIREGFCPLCYEGRRCRRFHKGHFGYRKWLVQKERQMAQFLHEPSKGGAERLIQQSVEMCAMATSYPAVWEHLTESAWASGKPRTTSTLMVFAEDGLFKLCLHDRSSGRTAWLSGPSLTAALISLERGLEENTVEWRKDKGTFRK